MLYVLFAIPSRFRSCFRSCFRKWVNSQGVPVSAVGKCWCLCWSYTNMVASAWGVLLANEAIRKHLSHKPTRCHFTAKQSDHRRGTYRCLGVGISFGGGQQRPGNLRNTKRNDAQLDGLLDLPCFRRLGGFIDSSFPFNCA